MLKRKNKILLAPIIAVIAVGLTGTLIALAILYDKEVDDEAARLRVMARSQARLIEAVARFDQTYSKDYPEGARAATLSQLVSAHREFQGFGETGAFMVAARKNDQIVFILANRRFDQDLSVPIPWDSRIAVPIRLALSGKSGVVIGPDDRGRMVLAAHEPISVLDLGIVAKIDLSEVRAPFIRAGLWAVAATLALIVLAIATFRRVTDPLLLEMIRSRETAIDASRAKSLFLANMSHELRTPLNAVIGFSDMMRHQVLGPLKPEKYRTYVEDIHASAQHLLGIISEILDMSKIEAGKYVLFKEPIPIRTIIEEAATMVKWRVDANRIGLVLDLPGGLPEPLADRRALRQILINLLGNAVKFTPPGGAITVSASADGRAMSIAISDTGIGIPPEDLERVVQPFIQVERERNRSHEGTGLGLPLSKALAEMHGGSLALTSTLGRGTTATVTLPLGEQQDVGGGDREGEEIDV